MNDNALPIVSHLYPLRRILTCCAVALPFLVLAVFFFGKCFVYQEQFLFRDAAHFYYPLFHEVARQWKSGEVPLWSPMDGIGVPLAADATSSVFYPGKLLLITPLGFGFGMRLYALVHFALAYFGMFWAARTWHCSLPAAVMAAVTYAFSGPVLGYHANIIFLVGAAWLPIALTCGWSLARRPALPSALGLAFALTMMVLGGDAQLAYHTMMMLTLAAIFFVLPWRRLPNWKIWLGGRTLRVGTLVAAAGLAVGLSAIQILPTSQWVSRSLRATSEEPRSLYEAAQLVAAGKEVDLDTLQGKPHPDSHARHSYDFSIPPWHWPEAFVANFSGQMYPRNQRWTRAIPAEGRIWLQTLFMGTLACLLAGIAVWHCPNRRVDRWLVAIGLFGVIASLGWYGLGWLLHEVGYGLGWDDESLPIGSPFGGLYWLLNMTLPKYAGFRYPAKWWIFVVFAVAVLAGRGLDQVKLSRRFGLVAVGLSGTFALAAVIVWLASATLGAMMPISPDDTLFGPLDGTAGLIQLATGLLCGSLAIAASIAALRFAPRPIAVAVIVSIGTVELMLANHWVAPSAPQQLWNPIASDQTSVQFENKRFFKTVYFDRSKNHYPDSFATTGSDERMVEGLKIDQKTNFPRYPLLKLMRGIPSVVSIRPRDMETVWSYPDKPLVVTMLGAYHERAKRWPVAWWQANVQWHDPIDESSPSAVTQGTHEILDVVKNTTLPDPIYPRSNIRPSRFHGANSATIWQPTVLEADATNRLSFPTLPASVYVFSKPNRIRGGQFEVELVNCQPGWVMLQDYYDDGWQCEIIDANGDTRADVPIYRANRVMMAVPVQQGDKLVRLTYWPTSFVVGAWITAGSVLLLLVLTGFAIWQALPPRRTNGPTFRTS
ncbi:hypothetical protein AB1L30_16255 [Bremerella sp. JC817]|uniref:YfhO family protein n=1 Tax=Bremerella sp. JC817 TaxID=3231756 RepID=UPI0034588659